MQATPDRIDIKDSASIIQTKRVLLLEDSECLKSLIKRFLESNRYTVEAVTHGAEGIRSILRQEFDIIICDMKMPRLSGDRFYFAVKKAMPHLCRRFIFITGYTGNSKVSDFIRQVNGAMLTKPFHLDELLDAVNLVQNLGYSQADICGGPHCSQSPVSPQAPPGHSASNQINGGFQEQKAARFSYPFLPPRNRVRDAEPAEI